MSDMSTDKTDTYNAIKWDYESINCQATMGLKIGFMHKGQVGMEL
jgi:hypothetical protein